MIKNLGLQSDQIQELLDFYHAVEHLSSVASLRKAWSVKERKAWIRKQPSLLSKRKADQVIAAVQSICKGRNGKNLTTERDYFSLSIGWHIQP